MNRFGKTFNKSNTYGNSRQCPSRDRQVFALQDRNATATNVNPNYWRNFTQSDARRS